MHALRTAILLWCLLCSRLLAQPIDYVAGALPDGGSEAWRWHGGNGALTVNADGELVLSTQGGADNRVGAVLATGYGELDSFVLDVVIDPASNLEGGGHNQLDTGISVGLRNVADNPNVFEPLPGRLSLTVRDLATAADFGLHYGGQNLALPVPPSHLPGGSGHPNALARRDGFYCFRLLVTPAKEGGTILLVYHTQFVDPAWEGRIDERIVAGHVGVFARLNQKTNTPIETAVRSLSLRPIEPTRARWSPTPQESVLYALNLNYPGLEDVNAAMRSNGVAEATHLFARYLRKRTNVVGPEVGPEALNAKQQRVADLMAEDRVIVHAGGPERIHDFRENPDWAADPYDTGGQFAIYNCRMWPWLDMGKAYRNTGDEKYPRAFVRQLNSWLDQIPLRIVAKEGNLPFFIDGVTLEPPLLFTGNMGRRIELTWWQAFEYFKQSPSFDDASMLRMMDYFARNARLVTNPSIFLPWDDSGLHMATGLLQCSTMMPEWREAEGWKAIAFERIEATFHAQVHPDGTHASLSTGYGWATIDSYQNVFAIFKRNGLPVPPKFSQAIRGMMMSYMSLLRPDFGNIILNDGGWGAVDDKVGEHQHLFPGDAELEYFASKGATGQAPHWASRYFPNAGWFVMRTGFGPREKYFFMDGGPFGASHGKQDALQIMVALGDQLLLSISGRGDYTAKDTSYHTGQTFAFNTLTPDWAGQNRIPRYEHEKYVGFHPPHRPWVSNEDFDYAESVYDAGWYAPDKRIAGTQTRRVVVLKGDSPPDTGYWVVVDTVRPENDEPHTWRHPWHLREEDFVHDPETHRITSPGKTVDFSVLPVDPNGNVTVEVVKGQREPVLQGWRVWGADARPFSVPMHVWTAPGEATKAWILMAKRADQADWEISEVSVNPATTDLLAFEIARSDGGTDRFLVRENRHDQAPVELDGAPMQGYFHVVRRSPSGEMEAALDVPLWSRE